MWSNRKGYYVINIKQASFYEKSLLDVWLEYCKLQAFKRLYIIFLKKNFSLKSVVSGLLIFFLGLPIRFLRLCYRLFMNPCSLRSSLESLYFENYHILKDCKIEILNKKIYLNCFTVGKFFSKFSKCSISSAKLLEVSLELQMFLKECEKYESEVKGSTELELVRLVDKNGNFITSPHYSYFEKNNCFHATNNLPSRINERPKILLSTELNQWKQAPINGMFSSESKNPGTIVSHNAWKIAGSGKSKFIPNSNLLHIRHANPDLFDLDPRSFEYFDEKKKTIQTILLTKMCGEYYSLERDFLEGLACNNYTLALVNSNRGELIEEINKIEKESKFF